MTSKTEIASIEITKTVYTVVDFLNWQRAGQLNLRPYFQRGSVWTPKARSYLIDTLIRGYPLPIIFLQNRVDSDSFRNIRQVVDGQQRLRTIMSYIDSDSLDDGGDEVTVLRSHSPAYAGRSFSELPRTLRDQILNTELSVHVLPSGLPDQDLLELFARLNSTGEKLNDQELRNAEFHGEFKAAAYSLGYSQLDRWRDWKTFNPRAIAQMKEVELTSELMMFVIYGLQAKSKTNINRVYQYFDDHFPFDDEVATRVIDIFDILERLFEPSSDGRTVDVFKSQSWIYPLFGLLHSMSYGDTLEPTSWDMGVQPGNINMAPLRRSLRNAAQAIEDAEYDEELGRALRGASTDRSSRQARYDFLIDHLL